MECAICRALVLYCLLFGLCIHKSLSQVLTDDLNQHLLPCFVSCICDNHSQVFCSDDLPFKQNVLNFNSFLLNTTAGENSRVHFKTGRVELPSYLHKLPLVHFLSLAENNISEVQGGALVGLRLRELNLSHNVIQNIQSDAFKDLMYLKILDLSHNMLTYISKQIFSAMPYLEVLNLDFNQLMYFPFDGSIQVPHLRELMVNNNNLSYLVPGSLVSLPVVHKFGLKNNLLWSFVVDVVDEMPYLKELDVSENPFHCSCAMKGLRDVVSSGAVKLVEPNHTTCVTPLGLRGQLVSDVIFVLRNCTEPRSVLTFDSKSITYVTDVQLSCDIQGDPDPAIVWDTPWGHQFADPSHLSQLEDVCKSCQHQRRYKGIGIHLVSKVSVLNNGKTLRITHFRGFFNGNITCRAYSFLGNATAIRQVSVYSPVTSCVRQSMIMGGISAAGFLCLGLLIGSIKLIVLSCLKRFGKKKQVVFTPPEVVSCDEEEHSVTEDSHCKDDSIDFSDDFYPPETPFTTPVAASPTTSPRKDHSPSDGQETPPGTWLPSNIMDTMEEVRWRLRYGVGRKMETVKRNVQSIKETSRRNVQSIKESGSVYVHNIMETGSTAANKVRAGVVLGMETVKYHVQSIKEFCGTGDMGTQTISMISVETNLDTNETREVVKSITIVWSSFFGSCLSLILNE